MRHIYKGQMNYEVITCFILNIEDVQNLESYKARLNKKWILIIFVIKIDGLVLTFIIYYLKKHFNEQSRNFFTFLHLETTVVNLHFH